MATEMSEIFFFFSKENIVYYHFCFSYLNEIGRALAFTGKQKNISLVLYDTYR
jgi:hypothetical protein